MPTKPTITKSAKEMQSLDIVNATINAMNDTTEFAAPYAVRPGDALPNGQIANEQDSLLSLRAIGNTITSFQPMANAFLSTLYNRIAFVMVTSRLYSNDWAELKKGLMEYGETIEEVFVELARPFQFDPEVAEKEVFKRVKPDVKSRFHSLNYQKFYKVTVSNAELKTAFLSFSGVADLLNKIVESMYSGANYDEFLVMKYMIAREALNGNIASVKIPPITDANARAVTSTIVSYAKNMSFMSRDYNNAGVRNYTDYSSLFTLLDTQTSSIFDVEVLALSFNMSKAELLGRQIMVDGFDKWDIERLAELAENDIYFNFQPFTEAELEQLATIHAVIFDKDWMMIFDNTIESGEIYNPQGLYWNYLYHTWKIFSTSPFMNAVMFTTTDSTITAVTIEPTSANVRPGANQQFTATVTGEGFVDNSVIWSLTGSDGNSRITSDGILQVGRDETATALVVKAVSKADRSVSGTANVTITV